jgi:hypothetical protein
MAAMSGAFSPGAVPDKATGAGSVPMGGISANGEFTVSASHNAPPARLAKPKLQLITVVADIGFSSVVSLETPSLAVGQRP